VPLDEASRRCANSDDQIERPSSVERPEIFSKLGLSSFVATLSRGEGLSLKFQQPGRLSAQLIADLPAPCSARLEIPVKRMKDQDFFRLSGDLTRLGLSGRPSCCIFRQFRRMTRRRQKERRTNRWCDRLQHGQGSSERNQNSAWQQSYPG